MKILKTFLLAIFAAIVQAQVDPDQTVEIKVTKYKESPTTDARTVPFGEAVKFKFLAAGNSGGGIKVL